MTLRSGWSVTPSIIVLRTRVLPRWFGAAGLIMSALYLLNQGDILATALPNFPVFDIAVSSAARAGAFGSLLLVSLCCFGRRLKISRAWQSFDLEVRVAFFVGLVLFIGVCGFLDTRLPWPPRPSRRHK